MPPERRSRRRPPPKEQDAAPEVPEGVTGKELDRSVRQQLRSLPDRLAGTVARHLVAAGVLLDTDPEEAYRHTLAARTRASRLAVVREACGEAAYRAGHYAEALAELRAARRINGAADYLPLIADCERALSRPERALAVAKDDGADRLDRAARVELAIVIAGARLDLGQPDMAVRLLEGVGPGSDAHAPWIARLRYAYADALLAGGRRTEAIEWFHRAVAADSHHVTDAVERLEQLDS